MSTTSQAVLQHLPFLRRYARALTGSQASGDAYVAATVEIADCQPQNPRFERQQAGGSLSAVHENLEFRPGKRKGRCG